MTEKNKQIQWNDLGKAYLEFLRNLTPIILIFSTAVYVWNRLGLELFTYNIDNLWVTLIIFLLFSLGVVALFINSYQFFVAIFEVEYNKMDQELSKLKAEKKEKAKDDKDISENLNIKEIVYVTWKFVLKAITFALFLLFIILFININIYKNF